MSLFRRTFCSLIILTLFLATPVTAATEKPVAAALKVALPHLYGYGAEINCKAAQDLITRAAQEGDLEALWLLSEMEITSRYYGVHFPIPANLVKKINNAHSSTKRNTWG